MARSKTYAQRPRNKAKTEQDIGTDAAFFKVANKEFNFAWDLAALPDNAKCGKFLSKNSGSGDGTPKKGGSLEIDWHKLAPGRWLWLNPPFNAIPIWILKCHEEAEKGAKIALLVPAANTIWWRTFVWGRRNVRLLNERLVFDYINKKGKKKGKRNDDPYPKDCQLILFDKTMKKPKLVLWSWVFNVLMDWNHPDTEMPIRKVTLEEVLR